MKDKLLKYILVLSLLLNFSFLGAAGYAHYRQTQPSFPPFAAPGHMHGMPDSFGPGMLFQELSLKPEQVKLFQKKAAVFHGVMLKKRQEVDSLRTSLIDLMAASNPDGKAIDETIARINTAQEEMQKIMVSHMLEFKSMLDRDRQKRFLDLVRAAMDPRKEPLCP